MSVKKLVRMLVDIVSKNGNLLLNIGPMADGTIPALQIERLEGLGAWLEDNGEAIFDTRPWDIAEGQSTEGVNLRFTQKPVALYTFLLDTPGDSVTIRKLRGEPEIKITLLGSEKPLNWRQEGDDIVINFQASPPAGTVVTFKLSPKPCLA